MASPSDSSKVKPEDLQRAVLIALESVEQVGWLLTVVRANTDDITEGTGKNMQGGRVDEAVWRH